MPLTTHIKKQFIGMPITSWTMSSTTEPELYSRNCSDFIFFISRTNSEQRQTRFLNKNKTDLHLVLIIGCIELAVKFRFKNTN